MDGIVKIIESEINIQVSRRLSEFIMSVARDFKIPAKLLLRYLEDPDTVGNKDPCCLGIKRDGKRCSRAPKVNGYCGFHKEQGKQLHKPTVIVNDTIAPKVVHQASPRKGVIDMSLIRI